MLRLGGATGRRSYAYPDEAGASSASLGAPDGRTPLTKEQWFRTATDRGLAHDRRGDSGSAPSSRLRRAGDRDLRDEAAGVVRARLARGQLQDLLAFLVDRSHLVDEAEARIDGRAPEMAAPSSTSGATCSARSTTTCRLRCGRTQVVSPALPVTSGDTLRRWAVRTKRLCSSRSPMTCSVAWSSSSARESESDTGGSIRLFVGGWTSRSSLAMGSTRWRVVRAKRRTIVGTCSPVVPVVSLVSQMGGGDVQVVAKPGETDREADERRRSAGPRCRRSEHRARLR